MPLFTTALGGKVSVACAPDNSSTINSSRRLPVAAGLITSTLWTVSRLSIPA